MAPPSPADPSDATRGRRGGLRTASRSDSWPRAVDPSTTKWRVHAPDASAMTAALAASCHAAGPSLVSLRLTPLQSPPSAAACWEVLQSAHRRSVIISSEVIVHTNGCTESSINGSGGGAAVSPPPGGVVGADARRRGKCKWFNVAKGWGFITPYDGGPDVFVHQSVIQMSGFRSLGDDEEVEFECKASDKGVEATAVSGPEGGDCKGSHRRPMSKKRFRKIRCYNCGEFANHIAAKCTMGPQPKRCHQCKSTEHLIADCPQREDKKATKGGGTAAPATTTATTSPPTQHANTNGDSSLPEEPLDNAATVDEAVDKNNAVAKHATPQP